MINLTNPSKGTGTVVNNPFMRKGEKVKDNEPYLKFRRKNRKNLFRNRS